MPDFIVQVAVGDQDGVLQVFSIKRQEVQQSFKTLPTLPITRLELGGALGTIKDKVCQREICFLSYSLT